MFEEEAITWEDKLNRIDALFDVWIDVQRRWVYLEGIFSGSADIKTLLPVETSRFVFITLVLFITWRTSSDYVKKKIVWWILRLVEEWNEWNDNLEININLHNEIIYYAKQPDQNKFLIYLCISLHDLCRIIFWIRSCLSLFILFLIKFNPF